MDDIQNVEMVNRSSTSRKKDYFKEFFNLGIILRGEVKYLEEIKLYIIENYVSAGLLKVIKPTYSKQKLCIVSQSEWEQHKKSKKGGISSDYFYFACILRGEVKNLEEIREYINGYIFKNKIELIESSYAKERIYVVNGGENE